MLFHFFGYSLRPEFVYFFGNLLALGVEAFHGDAFIREAGISLVGGTMRAEEIQGIHTRIVAPRAGWKRQIAPLLRVAGLPIDSVGT